jgi:ABC-type nitrate/sulfonate/bicarbonate transport system ATPase subunit
MNAYAKAERLMTINGLNLSYGAKPILRDVTVGVDNITRPGLSQGQVVALLGPSGCGKTQLFRCMAGLQPYQSGEITLMNKTITAGDIGVVQQAYPLLQHRTVWGNLKLAARGVQARIEEAEKMLAHFGILDKKDAYPLELSGGQQQRVAIVQQIISSAAADHEARFLLMDEPFSGLDVIAKERVMDTIRVVTTAHEYNTVILTSHDIESAVQLADDVWVLGREEGKVGATIVARFNLAERGLAWDPDILHNSAYWPTVLEIKELFHRI